ncbi:DNA polymerase I, partial [bacterium]|nr:DNA polymerase I [bacterium]
YGLSKDLGVSLKDAKLYIDKFFQRYPSVGPWMEGIIESVIEHGYVETFFGRRRYLPGIYEKNLTLFNLAKRMAINTRVQGTAAEIMKIGMIKLHKKFKENFSETKILLQIHDELLISCPEREAENVKEKTKQILEGVVDWAVPLLVSLRTGRSWADVSK